VIPFDITCSSSHEYHFASYNSVDILFSYCPTMLCLYNIRLLRPKFCKDVIKYVFVPEMAPIHYLSPPVVFVFSSMDKNRANWRPCSGWPLTCVSWHRQRAYRDWYVCSVVENVCVSGIAVGYGLDDRELESRQRLGIFLFTTTVWGAHPASYPVGIRGSFPGCKAAGDEADHSPPSSTEVKNAWSYTSIPSVRLHGMVLS
jgi:hypothetical protein